MVKIPELSEYRVLTVRHLGVSHFQCQTLAGSLCGSSSHIHNFYLRKHGVWLANIDKDMCARSDVTELRLCPSIFCLKSAFIGVISILSDRVSYSNAETARD
jgi:hypothetical protein